MVAAVVAVVPVPAAVVVDTTAEEAETVGMVALGAQAAAAGHTIMVQINQILQDSILGMVL